MFYCELQIFFDHRAKWAHATEQSPGYDGSSFQITFWDRPTGWSVDLCAQWLKESLDSTKQTWYELAHILTLQKK